MIDIQYIRDNAETVKTKTKQKGYDVDVDKLLSLDKERKELLQQIEEKRRERNAFSSSISPSASVSPSPSSSPNPSPKPLPEQISQGKELKNALAVLEEKFKAIDTEWLGILKQVPNMPLEDVPVGESEKDNQVAKTVGEPTKFDFQPKNHWEIGESRGWIDKERAAKVAGSRFAYIKGDLVKLQFAILQFGLDILTNEEILQQIIADNNLKLSPKPFIPILPPLMLKTDIYDAMDRLEPRDDRYKIEGEELWLQGSAEHVLGSMHLDEVFAEKELPIRYAGFATSFRREAGTYGKDMEGIIRMHQFDKLEMESLTTAETSYDEHLLMIAIQEYLMQQLELPYQMINKCTADIGKPNARGWDVEAWMPGQNKYRETHTADYMADYQARRLHTRVRRQDGSTELIHTNDATVFAMGRTMVAIIENFQDKDGKIKVPKVLKKYMGNREVL
jgi:seryl-tRNA synthetase